MRKRILFLSTLCIMCAACKSTKKSVMQQTEAVDTSVNKTFVFENDNVDKPHTVYITIIHNKNVNFRQLGITLSHARNGEHSFSVPIAIPLFDAQGNFAGSEADGMWKLEVPLLSDVFLTEEAQSFSFVSDEGRRIEGLDSIGIRIER